MLAARSVPVYLFRSNLCRFRSEFAGPLPLSLSSPWTVNFSQKRQIQSKKENEFQMLDFRDSFTAREVCEGILTEITVHLNCSKETGGNDFDLSITVVRRLDAQLHELMMMLCSQTSVDHHLKNIIIPSSDFTAHSMNDECVVNKVVRLCQKHIWLPQAQNALNSWPTLVRTLEDYLDRTTFLIISCMTSLNFTDNTGSQDNHLNHCPFRP